MTAKPEYGIDAPGVIRNLFAVSAVSLLIVLFGPVHLRLGPLDFRFHSMFCWIGGGCFLEGCLMLLYALRGKFAHRDRMLALHAWQGDEQVLDVGTGRGLLLVGAARKLVTGHAFGLDIWNPVDLSANSRERTEHNLALEGVAERCTLVSEGAQEMSFQDGTFDVILSNLCLHNIYDPSLRKRACAEIARVLKPGGTAIVSDYKLTKEYAEEFRKAGLEVHRTPANWLRTFPPLAIVIARKV